MNVVASALGLILFGVGSLSTVAQDSATPEFNALVLKAIERMPRGGTYATTSQAKQSLTKAIECTGARLTVTPTGARPSFCSSATYLVFAAVLEDLAKRGEIHLSEAAVAAVAVGSQRDGEGVWGRWNANGPGTARLFHETGLGRNFTDWAEARPGDFMKIFWTKEIGAKERGHSVVFLGNDTVGGVEYVRYWSSNMPAGYGEMAIPRKKVAWAIFSRLDRPARASRLASLPQLDNFLASMLTRSATQAEVAAVCGF